MAIYLKKVLSFIEMKKRAEDVDSQSFNEIYEKF